MNGKVKNRAVALLAGAAAVCLGGAIVCCAATQTHGRVSAAEASYSAFVNIGANEEALAADAALGLSKKEAVATTPGTETAGNTLFSSYAVGAKYTFTAPAGKNQIAVAIKAEQGKTLKVNDEQVSLAGKSGNTVVTVEKEGTEVTVEYDGALCGVLVAAAGSKILMTADYTPGQVISYGAEIAPQLDDATGYYSDGSTETLEIEYGEINAGTGVNINFTTVDVTGTIADTGITVSRYLTTMPDGLVYFINCGSYTTPDSVFPEPATVDSSYAYNQTVFDYYGTSLLNYGTPDRETTQGGDWGIYTTHGHNAPGDAAFPYNSFVWTGNDYGYHEMGYMLSGLNAATKYRIWFGTLSHWHARTVNITFNGSAVAGQETLRIPSSKSFSIFENIAPDASGKVDIHMTQVGSQNEPTICFIAVQPMSVEVAAAPQAPQGSSMVGMEDTTFTLTGGLVPGAALRFYNDAKPYQLLYEEVVDGEKLTESGAYTVDWGEVFPVSRFRVVQVTSGGASESLLVSVTDITSFSATLESQAYTTGKVKVIIEATADSGIVNWSYRLGEYGQEHVMSTSRPRTLVASFEAEENGSYYIVVTSGLGVTYSEMIEVNTIDPLAPVIEFTPAKEGWGENAEGKVSYNVKLAVGSIAPVSEYKLYRDGVELASAETAPETISFEETGEYTVYVKTAAGQSSVSTLRVSEKPITTVVRMSYERRQLRYSFGDSFDYIVYSVTAYKLTEKGVSKMTISAGNEMDVYDEGTYVVSVTTSNGAVEMFAINVTEDDLAGENTGVVEFTSAEGCGSVLSVPAAAIGAVLIAGVAVLTVFLKKKKS